MLQLVPSNHPPSPWPGSQSDAALWYCEPKRDPVRIGLRHEVDILWDGGEFPVYGGNLVAVIRHDGRTRTALLSRGKIAEFEDRAGEYRMEVLAFSEDILVIQQALQDPEMGPQQFECGSTGFERLPRGCGCCC